jgi:hypothetical protein
MRSILRTVPVALVAALALAAVTASSAFASPEWYVKKGGVWTKATSAVKVELVNTNQKVWVSETSRGSYIGVECAGEGGIGTEGSIGSAGKAEITHFELRPNKGSHCGPRLQESGFSECETFKEARTGNLPWSMELYSEGSETRTKIGAHSGGGSPFVIGGCTTALAPFDLECQVAESAEVISEPADGAFGLWFNGKTKKTFCSGTLSGGTESGSWGGLLVFKPSKTEAEKGVEGIKVE